MVLTDRQRADLHTGIYEYLQTQEGPLFEAAAAAYSCVRTLRGHDHAISAVLFIPSPPSTILSNNQNTTTGDDRTIRVMDIKTNRCIRTITDAHPHFVTSIAMHHTLPALISSGVDQTVKCRSLD